MKHRYETFGGIISSDGDAEHPPFLAFVDRQYMRELGLPASPLWEQGQDGGIGWLSAPTEVHYALTNRCSNGCPHCYMDSGQAPENELDTDGAKRVLDTLAGMGVFHVALGGGEALEREDLFEIAAYARQLGLVPNLTVSGVGITPAVAERMAVFGQVNLSLDGVGQASAVFRGKDVFADVDAAITALTDAGVPTGINCVLGRENYSGLGTLFAYAERKSLNEIEFLRLKPAGRCADYDQRKTTHEQNLSLLPYLAGLAETSGVTAKIDCSFVPMLCWHKPPLEALEAMATYGCEAGNVLWGMTSDGRIGGCSFLTNVRQGSGMEIFDMDRDRGQERFGQLHGWLQTPPEPCASCGYVSICKGGCRAVASHVLGRPDAPDPDCPFVVEARNDA